MRSTAVESRVAPPGSSRASSGAAGLARAALAACAALGALAAPAAAQCGDDGFENNDTCATAVPLPLGVTPGLVVYRQNADPDFYVIDIPNNMALDVDVLFSHAGGDIDVRLRDSSCASTLDSSGSASDDENVSYNNQTGGTLTAVLEVYVWNQSPATCNTYTLDVELLPTVVCGVDDIYEDNDFCGQHTPVTLPFNVQQLYVEKQDDDFYEFTLAPQEQLTVDVTFRNAFADVDVFVYDINVSCSTNTTFLATSQTPTDDEHVVYANLTGATQSIAVKIEVWAGSQGFCNRYDLMMVKGPVTGSCASLPDDIFEENDDCANAAPIGDGTYNGLKIIQTDNDFFTFGVAAGATLRVDALFSHADADVELFLYDLAVNQCGSQGASNTASSTSGTDNELIIWTNNTGSAAVMVLEVDIYNFSAGNCAIYDLILSGTTGGPPIGTPYCSANPNSTGSPAAMSASGSTSVAANDFHLLASDLPVGAFGYFLTSQTQGFVANPAGSQGNLCLGGAIGRFVGPGQIQLANSFGEIRLTVNLAAHPTPGGLAPVNAGETWNYTSWYRDANPNVTSNFANGLNVTFN